MLHLEMTRDIHMMIHSSEFVQAEQMAEDMLVCSLCCIQYPSTSLWMSYLLHVHQYESEIRLSYPVYL